jgi:hypothetical protein
MCGLNVVKNTTVQCCNFTLLYVETAVHGANSSAYGVEETSATATVAGCETDDYCHQHHLLHLHDDRYFLLADVHLHFHPGPYSHLLELSLTTKRVLIKSTSHIVHLRILRC